MIRGIFFDAAGVFYDRRESTSGYARKLLAERGYPVELPGDVQAHLNDLKHQATIGRMHHETYWDEFLRLHRVVRGDDREAFRQQILQHANQVYVYPGGRAALEKLRQRGFVLGLITDTMYPFEWKLRWLAKAGVAEYLDIIACSSVLGVCKPEPPIYLAALAQAKLSPAKAAFVGHDAAELDGAHRAGLVTVAVNYPRGASADYYAPSLADLDRVPIFARAAQSQPSETTTPATG